MIVRRLGDLIGTDRDVGRETFRSRRFLLASDGHGYSFHDTMLQAGTELRMWYKNHVESVYCVSGRGELEDASTGEIHGVEDGMFYCLDLHDAHILRAKTDLRLICVFTPALLGPELHDEDGSFPLLAEIPVEQALELQPELVSASAVRAVKQRKKRRRRPAAPQTLPAARPKPAARRNGRRLEPAGSGEW